MTWKKKDLYIYLKMKNIIYTNENGGVSVVIHANNSGMTREGIAAKDVPDGVTLDIVYAADLSLDLMFRGSWVKMGEAKMTDMPTAD